MQSSILFRGLLCLILLTDPAPAHAQTPMPKLQPRLPALHLSASGVLPAALLSISRQPKCSVIAWWAAWNRAQEGIRNRKAPDVLLLQAWLGIPPALR